MKITNIQAALGSAALLLPSCLATASHRHSHLHKRQNTHGHKHSAQETGDAEKRSGTCSFPAGLGLVAVTPSLLNGGWAIAPDRTCSTGSYCPYACPPGEVMAQWKPGSDYSTSARMDGGLYCDFDGTLKKPFEDKPYCVPGTGTVKAINKSGKVCSFCQTVLPGNEDMVIPTDVYDEQTLAVPDPSYWDSTAAHYYINAPGVSADEGCHWGDSSSPKGNWAYYVSGANTDNMGRTFVKLGINPIWESSALASTKPNFGLKIECPGGGCVGLPCSVDGDGVHSNLAADGAGGAAFCVVTVPKGGTGNIVVYNSDGSTGGGDSKPTTSAPKPTTSTTSSAAAPTTTSTSSVAPPKSTASSTSSSQSSTSSSVSSTSSKGSSTSSSSSSSSDSSSVASLSGFQGGIFQENSTSTDSGSQSPSTTSKPTAISTSEGVAPTTSSKSESGGGPGQGNSAIVGLIVALVAAAYLF